MEERRFEPLGLNCENNAAGECRSEESGMLYHRERGAAVPESRLMYLTPTHIRRKGDPLVTYIEETARRESLLFVLLSCGVVKLIFFACADFT